MFYLFFLICISLILHKLYYFLYGLLQIYLESISLRLNEDRPANNITSPGPIPIDLNISKLRVVRDTNGVFHVEPVGKYQCEMQFY